ncbi:MAG: FAD-dependent oxidoreductase [Bacteroidota bacterium]
MDARPFDGKTTSGKNPTYWLDSVPDIEFAPLDRDLTTDAVVVGGGMGGVVTAYLLAKEGLKVAIVEDGNIGSGETGRTSAHLASAVDEHFVELIETFGKEKAAIAIASHAAAIDEIEKIASEENIHCFFQRVPGYLFLHPSDKMENLEKEMKAALELNLPVSFVDEVPGIQDVPMPALRFKNQGEFHPLLFLAGVCQKIIALGGSIFTSTHASKVSGEGIETDTCFKISAKHIVVATNTPFNNRVAIHTKQMAYRTYVIGALMEKGMMPHALFWDTGDMDSKWRTHPYHYIRVVSYNDHHDLLLVGGEDHKTGQADAEEITEAERFNRLIGWLRQHIPAAQEVVYQWSGQIMEPVDGLAFLGRNPMDEDNVYIITGDSGNGLTHTVAGAMLIRDLILGRKNPAEEVFNPSRFKFSSLGAYVGEQANVAAQFADYFTKDEVDAAAELAFGEGAVASIQGKKAALYRDELGKLHAFSAICPHLKCVLDWNPVEKSFDCPCHGSRFTCKGVLVNGPANSDLEVIKIEDKVPGSRPEVHGIEASGSSGSESPAPGGSREVARH